MTLQRILSRKRGDKTYYKWQVTLSPVDVETLGWEAGMELGATVRNGTLTLRKVSIPKRQA